MNHHTITAERLRALEDCARAAERLLEAMNGPESRPLAVASAIGDALEAIQRVKETTLDSHPASANVANTK